MQPSLQTPAGLMVLARLANMVVGLATIPVLIHFLGGEGFAAWALLLAISAGFSTLEMGMAPTYVKHTAGPIQSEDWTQAGRVLGHTLAIVALAYAASAPLVYGFADALARRFRLPDGGLLSAHAMILLVFGAVALRALLQAGVNTLYAAQRFRAVATVSFLQPFGSNAAAIAAAIVTGRVDLTLICFWIAQLAVLAATCLMAQRWYLRRFVAAPLNLSMLRQLSAHGFKIQIYEWSQFVNFQFDKFLLAWLSGLWAVAPYEVANRSVLALRSIPASGMETFLPAAAISHEAGDGIWERYQAMTRLAAIAVIVFMIAPLAVAPIFLYAWTGEMGYVARWVFVALLLGAASNVLTIPAAAIAQAAGRTDLQARSAIASMLINIPLSFILVLEWELMGAAAGTGLAMLISSGLLLFEVHRAYGRPIWPTFKELAQFWSLLLVCAGCGLLAYVPFELWISSLDPGIRFSRHVRVVPGVIAGAAYLACLALMLVVSIRRGHFTYTGRNYLSFARDAFRRPAS